MAAWRLVCSSSRTSWRSRSSPQRRRPLRACGRWPWWTPFLRHAGCAGSGVVSSMARCRPLFGLFVAVVPGYLLFDAVGLKGHLGALTMGLLLASHPRSAELSRSLLSLKDLLLIAFFIRIGYSGQLTGTAVIIGLTLLLLIPVQAALYVALLRAFSFRGRTAMLTGLALANHSEFGLIVAAVGADAGWLEW